MDAAVRSSITNLRCVEGEDLSNPSLMNSDLPTVKPPMPGEPYLAPRCIFTKGGDTFQQLLLFLMMYIVPPVLLQELLSRSG